MPSFRPAMFSTTLTLATLLMPAAAAHAQVAAPPAAPLQAGFQDGFFIQTANGDNRLVFGMVAQIDGRFAVDDPAADHQHLHGRKIRPTLTGQVAKYFDFKVMPDFGNGTAVVPTRTSTSGSRRNSACEAARTRRRSATSCCRAMAYLLVSRARARVEPGAQSRHRRAGAGRSRGREGLLCRRRLQRHSRRHQFNDGTRHQQRQGPGRTHRRAAVSIDGDARRPAERFRLPDWRIEWTADRRAAVVQDVGAADLLFIRHWRHRRDGRRHAKPRVAGRVLLLQVVRRLRRVHALGAAGDAERRHGPMWPITPGK